MTGKDMVVVTPPLVNEACDRYSVVNTGSQTKQ
jgi:hypothetical protein